jgi:hypothetical protein
VSYHSKAATGRLGRAPPVSGGASGSLPLWCQFGEAVVILKSQYEADDAASDIWTVVSVVSVGFAVAFVGPHVCHDGCRVRSFLENAINGQLGTVAGL